MLRRYKLANNLREIIGITMMDVIPNMMSERLWLEITYLKWTKQHLNLDNPITFNEKIQWLKLYDRKPLYNILVDKYRVKSWAAEKIGNDHIIPTLAKFDKADDLDIANLPDRFVLKCNHDSGSVMLIKDKSQFDIEKAKRFFAERLKYDCSSVCGEWAYKDVPRCIIAEEYIEDCNDDALMDYKWFCFNGVPQLMYMSRDTGKHPTTDFFDMAFNHLPIRMKDPQSEIPPAKPAQFEQMREFAAILSENIPQVRVDFYVVNGNVYFGEMTLYHCGGMVHVKPDEWNKRMGDMILLPPPSNLFIYSILYIGFVGLLLRDFERKSDGYVHSTKALFAFFVVM